MNEKNKKVMIVIIVILIFILFVLSVASKMVVNEEELTEEQKIELIEQKKQRNEINKIAQMTERERIEYYLSKFVKAIENRQFEDAYEMLNEDFKGNYFKELNQFEEYARKHFPKEIAIECSNIERNNNLYILWITMSNPIAVDKSSSKELNVVIRENDIDDFELSFSVEQ